MVAAAIIDAAGSVLIAQRPPRKHLAGGWEFPGGKVDPGETPLEALSRELLEELGLEVGAGPHRPIRRVRHAYPDRDVLIEVWLVSDFVGQPRGLDGQALRWCLLEQLDAMPLLPADGPIVKALRLPACLLERQTSLYSLNSQVPQKLHGVVCEDAAAVSGAESAGADFVVLRERTQPAELQMLCRSTLLPVFARGIDLPDAWLHGATGVHDLDV